MSMGVICFVLLNIFLKNRTKCRSPESFKDGLTNKDARLFVNICDDTRNCACLARILTRSLFNELKNIKNNAQC